MGIKQQGQGMGLQAAAIASQINLNDSQAEKNRAEAKKTSGVDTRMQNANIDYVIAQTSNEKVKKGLIYANTRLLDAQEELQRTTVDFTKQKAAEVRQRLDYEVNLRHEMGWYFVFDTLTLASALFFEYFGITFLYTITNNLGFCDNNIIVCSLVHTDHLK